VDHRIDPLQNLFDDVRVADVAHDQFGVGVQIGGPRPVRMDLGIKVVEDPDPLAVLEQRVADMGADEPGAAGDENTLRHRFILPVVVDCCFKRR
jgi:hypothetical protein